LCSHRNPAQRRSVRTSSSLLRNHYCLPPRFYSPSLGTNRPCHRGVSGTSNTWLLGTGRETYERTAGTEHEDTQSMQTRGPAILRIRFMARTLLNLVPRRYLQRLIEMPASAQTRCPSRGLYARCL
jgi:hypothetical protein